MKQEKKPKRIKPPKAPKPEPIPTGNGLEFKIRPLDENERMILLAGAVSSYIKEEKYYRRHPEEV